MNEKQERINLIKKRYMEEYDYNEKLAEIKAKLIVKKQDERNVVFLKGSWSSVDNGNPYLAADANGNFVRIHERKAFNGKEYHSCTLTYEEFQKISGILYS